MKLVLENLILIVQKLTENLQVTQAKFLQTKQTESPKNQSSKPKPFACYF